MGINMTKVDKDRKRFYKNVKLKSNPNECWEWIGYSDPRGYGRFSFKGVTRNASRIVWLMEIGDIKQGLVVRHKCDNPCCVNLNHLELGTHKDNSRDAIERDRIRHGERHPQSTINKKQALSVINMLNKGLSNKEIINKSGFSEGVVCSIKAGLTWKRLNHLIIKDNLFIGNKYELSKVSKLNKNNILDVIDLINKGKTNSEICKSFNVTLRSINRLRIGRTWTKYRELIKPKYYKSPKVVGSGCGSSKLNESQVLSIIKELNDGGKLQDISNKFKVSKTTISAIKRGQNWKQFKHLLK